MKPILRNDLKNIKNDISIMIGTEFRWREILNRISTSKKKNKKLKRKNLKGEKEK